MVIINDDDYLAHYGILRRSGRYPWGSSSNVPGEDAGGFLSWLRDLRSQGLTDAQIAEGQGISTGQLRAANTRARNEFKQAQITQAIRLKEKGYSNQAIAARMGLAGESSVRALLSDNAQERVNILTNTQDRLKAAVEEQKYVMVGKGVDAHMGVSKEKLDSAIAVLQDEGYKKHYLKTRQLGTGKDTTVQVLTKADVSYSEVAANSGNIGFPRAYSDDGGRTFSTPKHEPISVNPDRVAVRYAEEGGKDADGVIYIRPGVDDLSMGSATYAQVRIKVGDDHYLKGMAMYKDDLPDGVDLMFNTNKSKEDAPNKLDAMKPIKDDPDLPFGSIVRQITENTGTPQEKNISALNIVNEEGQWSKWAKTISPQMLSKQKPALVKTQLDKTYDRRKKEYDEINALTNPTVKKKLLEEFAENTDSASVHLKAASFPRQSSHVILPIQSMKPTEVYAPNFEDGETVVLVRYPHGGTFEIPQLRVNNNQKEAKNLLGQARDAIGIHPRVAEQLSGADFDGDTVLVIPNNSNRISTSKPLPELDGFDPRTLYKGYDGMRVMSNTQTEMGKISNLITDMTIGGAPHSEIARAVKHSMVVIDAEKHKLNYKQSEIDNGITQLRAKYQPKNAEGKGGAATLISRAKSQVRVPDQELRKASRGGPVDPTTGKLVYEPTGKTNYKTGAPTLKKTQALAITDDAHTLSSGTPVERYYADYSNRLKSLANQARLDSINTPRLTYSPSANKHYSTEVASLNAKLTIATRNRPLERQAQLIANAQVKMKRQAHPDMDKEELKKVERQALADARARVGAKKDPIKVTPEEWIAIQAGAISDSKLKAILDDADIDLIRDLATPRAKPLLSSTKARRAEQMLNNGATRAEVAQALGVSLSTLDRAIYGTE